MTYANKLSAHYLDLVKTPVSQDSFAGADVRFSNEFEALECELGKAQSIHACGQVDWLKILEQSEVILRTQSKDLRVAAWLTWALYQRESFQGLLAGLCLLHYLCKHHWAEIHPAKARTRAASFSWLLPRLEQALGDHVAIKEQLLLFHQMLEQLEGIETVCTAHLGNEAPLILPLSRRLDNMIRRVTEHSSTPAAIETVVAQVKQAATQLFSPGAHIETEKEAHKALRAQQEGARSLCAWWLKQKVTDVRALRLNRVLPWLAIDAIPEHNAEQLTLLRGLPPDKLKGYQDSLQRGSYADLLVEIEASLAKAPFWLDGQRLAWECLQGLGAELAMRELEIHFALFIQRLPGILELRWHDGVPFADPATRTWIAAQVMPHLQCPGASPTVDITDKQAPWELALEEAQAIVLREGLKTAVQSLRQGMQAANGARERFLWRFAMARLCFSAKKYELAKVQLEALDQRLQNPELSAWEPELALQVLHLLHHCCELLPQNHSVRERKEETFRRLCHLDLERVIE
ncbi:MULTISPECIES: type VI secretion system protein TssA [unclassified Pseudomonas]|uniref:type VI secretion system protein TssA n=1 Tax=unclassified Pseudomonas TaxID=196821 RepID=UPI00119A838F|nr:MULTISPECIES: type VI secretion system protein TssA [unclassified Pseudomonas]TWC14474.1 type VI secretion system protein VasJ [Pseudomonas sp. SJZ074]TWC17344.1 type VI secretion system protein VasJ [Pseudomonas sp. SJZ075]TWC32866.1 type VI secretion system protein VasJ [Pseudomonas sp. SJZ085]TWC33899.1 type VI secretion system protein VasJ [Pseudomonas sp. SJZ078]TWC54851.1 type VI secretion system protein VasJ [Pseudomonas sp. SJZ124]